MNLHLYLPIAQTSVSLWLLLGLGVLVGFLSGLFGVGGGFLLTPLLIMIGIPPTVAAASDSNQIVAASTSGTYAHWRLGNVDFKMGIYLIAGGILGGTVGVQIIKVLRSLGNADFVIKICFVVMLGLIGGYMMQDSLRAMRRKTDPEPAPAGPEKEGSFFSRVSAALPMQTEFVRSGVRMSALLPIFFGIVVGVLAAIMGVGGGFIMVPVMVYMLRMPMHVVLGTSLFQILFTCVNVTIMQAHTNHNVDFMLALLLLLGSTVGAQIGAKAAVKLNADQLKILLATIVLIVMVKMLFGLLLAPDLLLTFGGGH